MTATAQTPFERGKCTSKKFTRVTRWKCVDVQVKEGIDRQEAEREMHREDHFNACHFCRDFVPDKDQSKTPAPPAKAQKSASTQSKAAPAPRPAPNNDDLDIV